MKEVSLLLGQLTLDVPVSEDGESEDLHGLISEKQVSALLCYINEKYT